MWGFCVEIDPKSGAFCGAFSAFRRWSKTVEEKEV